MKKRLCLLFALLLACVCLTLTLTACGEGEHIHTPNSTVRENEVSATCTAVGSYDEVVYCSECNEEISRTTKTTEMLSHTLSDWITDTEATCKVEGEKHKECTVCHTELETSKIDKLTTHTPKNAVKENEVDAKCNVAGSYDEVVYCSVCDTELSREEKEIAKLPHTEVTDAAKAPSCTETGLTEGKHCSVCNEVLVAQKIVKANGHTDENNDFACDICKADLCTEHKEEIIPAVSATCTESGLTEGKKCSICGDILVAQETVKANGHSYTVQNTDSKYLDKAADCENAATYFYSCSCGEKGATAFAYGEPNGHSYTVQNTASKYFATAADCENAATYFYSCACGDKGTTTFAHGEPNGHSFVVEKADIDYQHTPATEYSAAIYYKSCSCGKASTTETFTYGDMLPGYLTYKLSEDSSYYIVTGYVGAQAEISVPHLYDGLPVFVITEGAFRDNTYIKSITMPNSIQVIGSYAFANCTSLESIIIPTSVTDISPYTFSGCTALETITLHSGIEVLGTYAFEKCSALKSITLNEGLKTISDNAFDYCTALESILIPDTVTTLGNMAFRHAESLGTVKFSKALKAIGNSTFQYCVKLESVELHENIDILGNSTFSYCDGLKSIRILGNLTTIGKATFYECRSLEAIYYASSAPGNCGDSNYIFYNAGINGEGIVLTIAKDAVIPEGFFTPYVAENLPKITKIIIENGSINVNFALQYNNLPHLTEVVYPDTVTYPCYGAFNNSPWWDNQNFGEVFINGIFYGYKCHCYMATPEEPVTENYHDSTCTEDGSYDTVIYCDVCGDELSRATSAISAKGHTERDAITENFVDSDCENDGSYDSVIYCEVCNDELSRETITIAKKGHTECDAITENFVDSNCENDGSYDTVIYCEVCNDELSRETITIAKKGHLPKSAVEENRVEATCTVDGHYDSVVCCIICNNEISRNKITIPFSHKVSGNTCSVCGGLNSSSGLDFTLNSNGKGYTVTGIGEFNGSALVIDIYNNLPVTAIDSSVFFSSPNLESIVIGSSLTTIDYSTFSDCKNLTNITVDEKNRTYKSIDGNLYSKNEKILIQYAVGKASTSYTIPIGVTHIGERSFYCCSNLKSVTIPDSVTSIGNSAFYGCAKLNSVYIDNLSAWCNIKFADATANPLCCAKEFYINGEPVTNLVIPNSVTEIKKYTFAYFDNLRSVTIPDNVTNIRGEAFLGCNNLESISLPFVGASTDGTSNTHFGYIFGAYTYSDNDSYVPASLKTVLITGGTNINSNAFSYCRNITSIKLPNSVTSIGSYAFNDCKKITSITIPDNVTSIGSYAFKGCYKLIELINKSSLTISKHGLFSEKEHVCEIHSGDSKVKKIDDYIFYTYGGINYLIDYVGTDVDLVLPESYNGQNYEIYQYAFYDFTSLITLTVPDSVTAIGTNAFCNCTSLIGATIGSGIESIGVSAFYNCNNLESISLPFVGASIDGTSNTHFGYIFGASTYSDNDSYVPASLKTVVITGGTHIYSCAFAYCYNLTSVTIPTSTTSIGDNAFYDCNRLESITLPFVGASKAETTQLKRHFGFIFGYSKSTSHTYSYHYYDFKYYYTYNIPSSLKEVVLSEGIAKIDYEAFYNCQNITSITIPNSVTTISHRSFCACSNLTSVIIGNSVTSIGESAFYGCINLKNIRFRGTQPQWVEIWKGENWDQYSYGKINYTITYNYTAE